MFTNYCISSTRWPFKRSDYNVSVAFLLLFSYSLHLVILISFYFNYVSITYLYSFSIFTYLLIFPVLTSFNDSPRQYVPYITLKLFCLFYLL